MDILPYGDRGVVNMLATGLGCRTFCTALIDMETYIKGCQNKALESLDVYYCSYNYNVAQINVPFMSTV
jgi:hypothetical protein